MSKISLTKTEQGEHWLVGGETTTIKVSGEFSGIPGYRTTMVARAR